MLGNTVHPFEQSVTGKRCWDLITRHLGTVAQLPECLHRKLAVSSGHHHDARGVPTVCSHQLRQESLLLWERLATRKIRSLLVHEHLLTCDKENLLRCAKLNYSGHRMRASDRPAGLLMAADR